MVSVPAELNICFSTFHKSFSFLKRESSSFSLFRSRRYHARNFSVIILWLLVLFLPPHLGQEELMCLRDLKHHPRQFYGEFFALFFLNGFSEVLLRFEFYRA